jgi:hypothetical protein
VKHRSSLTPTRLPHDGQTTDPHFCLNIYWNVGPTGRPTVDAGLIARPSAGSPTSVEIMTEPQRLYEQRMGTLL